MTEQEKKEKPARMGAFYIPDAYWDAMYGNQYIASTYRQWCEDFDESNCAWGE